MRSRRLLLAVFLCVASSVSASGQAGRGTEVSIDLKIGGRKALLIQPSRRAVAVEKSNDSNHAGKGALIGAAIGLGAGLIGGSLYHTGCLTSSSGGCNESRSHVGLMVVTGFEGAAAGAAVGGLIGYLWPGHE